jgi:hypothetical protein
MVDGIAKAVRERNGWSPTQDIYVRSSLLGSSPGRGI